MKHSKHLPNFAFPYQWIRSIGIVLIIALNTPVLLAQVSFEAFADAKQIIQGSTFELRFVITNGSGKGFSPPRLDNFIVITGPDRSMKTSLINSQRNMEVIYSYILQPKQIGTFTIGPAKLVIRGETYTTKPMEIEVVDGVNLGEERQKNVFIKAELSTSEAYVGQQITLDYKVYTTVNIETYNVLEESNYQGFYAEDIKRHDTRIVREVIDGVEYLTRVLKRVALFPQQAGLLDIGPLHVQLGLVQEGKRDISNSFSSREIDRRSAQTETIAINVLSLPTPTPSSFTGAVGNYKVETNINRVKVTTDDVISLKLFLTGNGDIKRIQAPDLNLPPSFDFYDPKVLDASSYEVRGEIIGKKEFEYLILPKTAGTFDLVPEITYFSPDSSKYVTYKDRLYAINIRQGSKKVAAEKPAEEVEKSVQEIKPIKRDITLSQPSTPFFGSATFWMLSLLPICCLGGMLIYKSRISQKSQIDPLMLKQQKAKVVAQKRLGEAEKYLKTGNSRSFYDEVAKAMQGYICDKLQIPRSELTKQNIREKMEGLQMPPIITDQYIALLQTCEMAVFAGKDNPQALKETYEQAFVLVKKMEEEVGRK